MMMGDRLARIRRRDRELVRIVDAAMAESTRLSGDWVKCRPGCTPCCLGPFGITALDALRLRDGLAELRVHDSARASAVQTRAAAYAAAIAPLLSPASQGFFEDEDQLPDSPSWDDTPCPALDPASGRCDLYAARPIICRTFGAAIREEGALGCCELCYQGATGSEIARCAVTVDPGKLGDAILSSLAAETPSRGSLTLVAFALLPD